MATVKLLRTTDMLDMATSTGLSSIEGIDDTLSLSFASNASMNFKGYFFLSGPVPAFSGTIESGYIDFPGLSSYPNMEITKASFDFDRDYYLDVLEEGNFAMFVADLLSGRDTIKGSIGDDQIDGFLGSDRLFGANGDDHIVGGGGNDQLSGQAGDDQLAGFDGKDVLIGGADSDLLFGETGRDTFRFDRASDSPAGDTGQDTIGDFNRTEGDKIDLSRIDANSGAAGDDPFVFIGKAAFSGKAGELRYIPLGGSVTLQGDVDGDGMPDLGIDVELVNSLKLADFLL